ncbi:MAG: hypothetical protein AAF702_12550 [Chloroflexota bacterium]
MAKFNSETVAIKEQYLSAGDKEASTAIVIRQKLATQKDEINQTIREYPRPITACDEQFNLLLEKRVSITQEIIRLERIIGQVASENNSSDEVDSEQLKAFVASSAFLPHQ